MLPHRKSPDTAAQKNGVTVDPSLTPAPNQLWEPACRR
jgi:hypothetical protein